MQRYKMGSNMGSQMKPQLTFINPFSGRICAVGSPIYASLLKKNIINSAGISMLDYVPYSLGIQKMNSDGPSKNIDTLWICYGSIDTNNLGDIGKWILSYQKNEIDIKWKKICNLIDHGHLFSAKVSTYLQKKDRGEFTIVVYTNNCKNKKEIFNIGTCIKSNLKYDKEMYYKTNIQDRVYIRNIRPIRNTYLYAYSELLLETKSHQMQKIIINVVGMKLRGGHTFQSSDIINYEFDDHNPSNPHAIKILVDNKYVANVYYSDCAVFKNFVYKYNTIKIQLDANHHGLTRLQLIQTIA
jgi:hypothetical protein